VKRHSQTNPSVPRPEGFATNDGARVTFIAESEMPVEREMRVMRVIRGKRGIE